MNTQDTNQLQPAIEPGPTAEQAPQQAAAPAAPPAPPGVPIRRSPGLALVLSFFPGLGHLYLGLYQRAFTIFLCFALAIWMAEHSTLGIVIAFVWFFAVIDAYRQAQCINLGLCPEPVTGTAVGKQAKRGALGFGVFLVAAGAVMLYNQFYPIDFSFLQDWWPLLLVLAGLYLVGAHFREKRRQAGKQDELPPPAA